MTYAGTGPAEPHRVIGTMAAEVAERLARLRQELEPSRDRWNGSAADLRPADEWTIAVDGLLGPDGVLGQITRAMRAPWTDNSSPGPEVIR